MNIHMYMYIHIGGGFSPIENISQIGSFPLRVKLQNIWNHRLVA